MLKASALHLAIWSKAGWWQLKSETSWLLYPVVVCENCFSLLSPNFTDRILMPPKNSSKITPSPRFRDSQIYKDEKGELVSSQEVFSVHQQWNAKGCIDVSTTQAVSKELLSSEIPNQVHMNFSLFWNHFPTRQKRSQNWRAFPPSHISAVCKHCACHNIPRRFPLPSCLISASSCFCFVFLCFCVLGVLALLIKAKALKSW